MADMNPRSRRIGGWLRSYFAHAQDWRPSLIAFVLMVIACFAAVFVLGSVFGTGSSWTLVLYGVAVGVIVNFVRRWDTRRQRRVR